MTNAELLATLKQWQDVMQECDLRLDALAALTGPIVESPLGDAVYRLMGCHTDAIADLIGWDESTLTSWWCDHNFGERPMKIANSTPRTRRKASNHAASAAIFVVASSTKINKTHPPKSARLRGPFSFCRSQNHWIPCK